ncbi:DUF2513 domain-containing protein [Paracoccus luteus]|uniref:DUF2513 domain-containing protein n=1 Tax=Paracoccus luteus TaxID=2508543 RepID=UPI0014312F74|nr:DUF2513 domain-containing protein [Paracoccus luteus]
MKRDDDFLRDLLLSLEADPEWVFVHRAQLLKSSDPGKARYHFELAADAGLITDFSSGTFRLTSTGHDYLAAIKDNGIWAKTKEVVAEQGGSASLEIMKNIAVAFVKKQIEQRTGLIV